MPHLSQTHIIDTVKEITVAKLANDPRTANAESGKAVADFMQAIYDKLVELDEKS